MEDFFKEFCTDKNLEVEGVLVELPQYRCIVKVARSGNRKHMKANMETMKPFTKYFKNGSVVPIPEDVQEKIRQATVRVYAETILLGWEGIKVEGKEFPYSVDNAVKLLSDDDFFAVISEIANTAETFRRVEIEDNVKNSKKASSGN